MQENRLIRLKKEEFVYMDCSIRMSTRVMADLLYATIMTGAAIPTTWGIGIYDNSRNSNSYNRVDVKIHIHPTMIDKFEHLSDVKLKKPISVTI